MNGSPVQQRPVIKGRGSSYNPVNRFDLLFNEPDPDWNPAENRPPKTEVFRDTTKQIISFTDSPDLGIMASLNPYRGCEHGCIYCYARPGHEYFGLSAGVDFETKIFAKPDAPALLRKEISRKSWRPQPVVMSGVTDPYQPIERRMRITRGCLEVFLEFRNPVGIITKNALVTRDVDLLKELNGYQCAAVNLSITSLNPKLARVLEPRASTPAERLRAVEELSRHNIPVNVMVAPIVPALNDEEIPSILKAVASAGAISAAYVMLRLPHANKELFQKWLEDHFPERKEKVLNRIRAMRGGKLYDSTFGARMRGTGVHAEQINRLFEVSAQKNGLNRHRARLSLEYFRNPFAGRQYMLFD